MHEMGIARDVLDIVRRHAGETRVSAVLIEAGAFSGVNPDALRFCTEVLFSAEAGMEPAVDVRWVPGVFRCRCGRVYRTFDPVDPCPACGGFEREMTGGDGVRVVSLDVGDDGGTAAESPGEGEK